MTTLLQFRGACEAQRARRRREVPVAPQISRGQARGLYLAFLAVATLAALVEFVRVSS